MPQSCFKVYVHIVFHIKRRSPSIDVYDRPNLHTYISELFKQHQCSPIIINGVGDHVHCLVTLGRMAKELANIVGEVKRRSSIWLKNLSPSYKHFYWQGGYGVFSIAYKDLQPVINYIKNQEEHHKQTSTFDEMKQLYLKNGGEVDPTHFFSE